jgi:hypothetical protein
MEVAMNRYQLSALSLLILLIIGCIPALGEAAPTSTGEALSGGSAWAYFQISSSPSSGNVMVDGSDEGNTPTSVKVPALESTTYTIFITKLGYNTWTKSISGPFNPNEVITINAQLIPSPVTPPTTYHPTSRPFTTPPPTTQTPTFNGAISATTSPVGAAIYVDGRLEGYSPLTIWDLEPRTYTVKSTLSGYSPDAQYISVSSGQTTYYYANLQVSPQPRRDTGEVSILTIPSGASIYVDGTYRGLSPTTLTLYPGSHSVKLSLTGYNDWTGTVYVNTYATTPLQVGLTPLQYGKIQVQTSPSEASIYFDNAYTGQSNSAGQFTINMVTPGPHVLRVSRQGYTDYVQTVSVQPGASTTINVYLSPGPSTPATPPQTPVQTPVPVSSSVAISSSPPGANVMVDNVYRGLTPLTLTDIPAGAHTVTLQMAGYQNSVQNVVITPGQATMIQISLTPVQTVPPTQSGISLVILFSAPMILAVGAAIRRKIVHDCM